MSENTAVIIGAGIGGIAAATRLARHGYRVTVVEKNDRPGGRCGSIYRDGHTFPCGPTLFLMPELYAQTFADLGERIEDHLDLRRIDPTYHVHFCHGPTLKLTTDMSAMRDQLEAIEPGSFRRYVAYLDQGRRHYKLSLAHLVQRNFRTAGQFFTPRNFILLLRLRALTSHHQHIRHYFKDPRLQAAFTFQDMYVGLNPYEAPALFSLLQYSELVKGVWFPMGGLGQVADSLVEIAEKWGVRFIYSLPVRRIDVTDRQATGVTLANGTQLQAELIVANADLPYVYRHLLPDAHAAHRLDRKRYSCSALVFHWAVDKSYPQLHPHHLFFASDIGRNYRQVTKECAVPDDPSFYLHAPVRMDTSLAPPGHESMTVVVPVGHLDKARTQDWPALRERTRQVVLNRLRDFGLRYLEDHIKFEISYGPREWRDRFNLVRGASHGLSHNLLQMGYFRPHNRHNRYRNLYFVGASTHPGTGLPTVLVSARLVVERILPETRTTQPHSSKRPAFALSRQGR